VLCMKAAEKGPVLPVGSRSGYGGAVYCIYLYSISQFRVKGDAVGSEKGWLAGGGLSAAASKGLIERNDAVQLWGVGRRGKVRTGGRERRASYMYEASLRVDEVTTASSVTPGPRTRERQAGTRLT